MAFIKDSLGKYSGGAQRKMIMNASVSATDLGTDTLQIGELPAGAVVTDSHVVVTAAFVGTAPALDVVQADLDGTAINNLQVGVDVSTSGRTSADVVVAPEPGPTLVTLANSTDSPSGEVSVYIEYFVADHRADENAG